MISNNKPLVSVVIPSYNHGKYMTQCIESIMNQSYRNFELIVIDDGSTDNSAVVLNSLQSEYGFKLIIQKNHGISYTLNRGIREFAHGKYFAICASDDYWSLNKLEIQVNFMEANSFYPMCYGKTYYINEDSIILNKGPVLKNIYKGGWLFEDIFLFKLDLPVNCIFRRSIFEEVGFYDDRMAAEDYYMDLKISSKYAIGFVDEYLGYYRLTDIPFKNIRFDLISDSHLKTIELFKDHKYYKKAKTLVYLRKFDTFSGFTYLKKKAISNIEMALPLFYHKRFLISCIKLLLFWKQ